jgi:ribonuclease VapC
MNSSPSVAPRPSGKNRVADFVFDTSAVLAMLFDEPGARTVSEARLRACMSVVNHSEVIAKLIEEGMTPSQAEDMAARYGCDLVDADRQRSILAGHLYDETRRKGVSLGDRYCLQLAMELGLPVLTADRHWASLGLDVEVVLIR